MDSLADVPLENEGAKVIDHSSKWYFEGQYDFSQHIRIFDLIAGADYRITNLKSEGTIFTDSIGNLS
jgi:hypothetical protein